MTLLPNLINRFIKESDDAKAWGGTPNDFTNAADCDVMSIRFQDFLRGNGIEARVVKAKVFAPHDDMTDVHYFVVTDTGLAFDWTARQFYNLDGFPLDYDDIPCPLLFAWPGTYPLPLYMEEVPR